MDMNTSKSFSSVLLCGSPFTRRWERCSASTAICSWRMSATEQATRMTGSLIGVSDMGVSGDFRVFSGVAVALEDFLRIHHAVLVDLSEQFRDTRAIGRIGDRRLRAGEGQNQVQRLGEHLNGGRPGEQPRLERLLVGAA